MPNNIEIPGIPEPRADLKSLVASVQALKQIVEVMQGSRGTGANQVALNAALVALEARVTKLGG